MVLGDMPVVDDPATAPLAAPLRSPTDFPDAARCANDVAGVWVRTEKHLKRGVTVVIEMRPQMLGEFRCLDEQHATNYT